MAEDAAEEAALQGFLCLDSLRRGDRFGPWLGGIGLNVCRQWLRARSYDYWSWEALQGGLVVRDLVEPGSGPEELAEVADLRERVQRAVAELPRGQRGAVLLFYLSGMTHAEVAAHLGIEVGAVKTRLYKARAALRRRLWAEWKEEAMATEAGDRPPVSSKVVVHAGRRPMRPCHQRGNMGCRPSTSVKPYSLASTSTVRTRPDFSSTLGSAARWATARPVYSGDSPSLMAGRSRKSASVRPVLRNAS